MKNYLCDKIQDHMTKNQEETQILETDPEVSQVSDLENCTLYITMLKKFKKIAGKMKKFTGGHSRTKEEIEYLKRKNT